MSADDPFTCFGDDDDNDDESKYNEDGSNAGPNNTNIAEKIESKRRDDNNDDAIIASRDENSCGVLSFHQKIEESLMIYITNVVFTATTTTVPNMILSEIDKFCERRHWMMHVGPEKGNIVTEALQSTIDRYLLSLDKNSKESATQRCRSFTCVELGSYCGYSSILLGTILRLNAEKCKNNNIDFHLYTMEINPRFAQIASKMIKLAKLDDFVTVLQTEISIDGTVTNVANLIKSEIRDKVDPVVINFLFIDHDKDMYLTDFKRLDGAGLLKSGSVVVADNVLFANIENYMKYMKDLEKEGLVSTETREATVEYCNPDNRLRDGVEITSYLKDPSL